MKAKNRFDWFNFFFGLGIIAYFFAIIYFVVYKFFIHWFIPWLFSFDLTVDILINQAVTALIFLYVKGYFLNEQCKGDSNGRN